MYPNHQVIVEDCETVFRNLSSLWTAVGVSENIIEAICQALVDSLRYLPIKTRPAMDA
jgi:hypothetical protein